MIKFFKSNYDEFDSDVNGGMITSTIIEGSILNNLLPAVRPRQAEMGATRWFKFFFHTDRDIVNVGLDVSKFTTSPTEEVYLAFESADDDVESDLDKESVRVFGGFSIDEIDHDNKKIVANIDVSDFVKADDNVAFYDNNHKRITAMIVDSVDEKDIVFKVWSDKHLDIGNNGSSTLYVDSLSANSSIGVWVKETIAPYTEAMEDPLNEFILNVWYDLR